MNDVRRTLLLTALAILCHTIAPARELSDSDRTFLRKNILVRLELTSQSTLQTAFARNVYILDDHPSLRAGYVTALVSREELDSLEADGYDLTVLEDDWYGSRAQKSPQSMGGFLTWSEITMFLDSLHAAYPGITSAKFSLGWTHEAREMWAMKISDNPELDESEPEILFDALTHPNEPLGGAVVLETMRQLAFNYGSDTFLTRLVNEREIYFVPVVNPDGYVYNETIAPMGGGEWRKNRNPTFAPVFGVDINRNYDDHWGLDDVGSSPDPSHSRYRGESPASEPEVQNMQAFIDSRQFVFQVSFHSYGDKILWPPGFDDYSYTPDQPLYLAIGDSLVKHNGYLAQPSWLMYLVNGGSADWGYYAATHPKVYSLYVEVGAPEDVWPADPETRIPEIVAENLGPNIAIIDLSAQPERVYAPAAPAWMGIDSSLLPDYTLSWSDPGGLNGAIAYRLRERIGLHRGLDAAEDSGLAWNLAGFYPSTARSTSGVHSYFSGRNNNLMSRMVSSTLINVLPNDSLKAKLWFDLETDWDYFYAEISTDSGQTWFTLPGNLTTNYNPNGTNRGNGITGFNGSGGVFVDAHFPIGAYSGQSAKIRFSYESDIAAFGEGVYLDDIQPAGIFDSVIMLASSTPLTLFNVTGKAIGTYWYDLRSTDADVQVSSIVTHRVDVACACACHADPAPIGACDGAQDVLDVVQAINVAFRGAESIVDPYANCPYETTDVDCSGSSDIIDVVHMVNVAFRGSSAAAEFCSPCP